MRLGRYARPVGQPTEFLVTNRLHRADPVNRDLKLVFPTRLAHTPSMFGRFLLSLVAWIVLGFGLLVPLQPPVGTPYWVEWAVFAGVPFLLIGLCMRGSQGNAERRWYMTQELLVLTIVGTLALEYYY